MVEFSHAFDQGRQYSGVGMDIRKPTVSTSNKPAGQSRPQPRQPSPVPHSKPSGDGSDWATHDPWNSNSDGNGGGEANWGMQDPWANKK